ncbi:MAG: phosphoribosylglycinamide formyltransferase [Desulfovibrionaceae bacterium]|nr:phosphoribosylglycinamide formyltransferase [Desulfovibrionaceae bacterium]
MALKLAILASGTGTNAQAMIDKSKAGLLDVEICLIASNKKEAKVLERGHKAQIPTCFLDPKAYPDRTAFDLALLERIIASGAEAIALAGYMRMLSSPFLAGFQGPVLNLHPALLPSFPGLHGAADAINYGVKISGATVHFVDEEMDHGPVIIQAAVPVKAHATQDTLLSKIHALEHRIYPQALQWLAQGRISVENRVVHVEQRAVAFAPTSPNYLVYPPLEAGF